MMIRRAVERGVSADRIAKALHVDISVVRKKINLLVDICPEAIDVLKDRQFSADLGSIFRKMKPTRQVECAELMVSANTMTIAYAEALLAATPPDMLVEHRRQRKLTGVTPEQVQRMQHEMVNLQGQYRLVEQSYGDDVLNLVLAKGFLAKLLDNPNVLRYLTLNQPDVLEQFTAIVHANSLDQQKVL